MTREKNLGIETDDYVRWAGLDSDWRDTWWHQDFLELVARRLELGSVREALDIGCGAGHFGHRVSTLLEPGAQITGIDHEPAFLDVARERAKRFDAHSFTYQVGDVEALPYPDESFDLVTCQTVLMHVADPSAVLKEMVRVTRPGGWVITAEPDNLINALVWHVGEPEVPTDPLVKLLTFERTCIRGKRALGRGDNAIGEKLGRLLAQQSLRDVRVYKNDRCATWTPPYESPAERMSVEQLLRTDGEEISSYGTRDSALACFEAGGGEPAAFDALWAVVQRERQRMIDAVKAQTYRVNGSLIMILAAGRVPTEP